MRRLVFILTAAVLAVSCGRSAPKPAAKPTPAAEQPPPGPQRGGTVVIGELADIDNWNPYLTETAFADDVLALLYPNLAVEQVDYRDHPPSFAPSLAESWERSADGLSLTFHLRTNVAWSDGVPVTAEDVLFSYAAQTSSEVAWSGMEIKAPIRSVTALDAHTVRFTFTRVYPYQLMDANDGAIIPAHAWRSIPFSQWERTDWAEHALSAGPFKLESQAPQQQFILSRNDTYWRADRPLLDRVVWRIIPDQNNMLTQLQTGAIDMMEGIPPRRAERVRGHPRLQLIVFPDRSYAYIGWNTRKPPFNDVRVRQGITLAIDRSSLLDTVLRGFGRPSLGPVLSTMWGFNRNLQPWPHDPEAARKLLTAAGWSDSDGDGIRDRNGHNLSFELMTNSGNEVREDLCLLVRDQLAAVGIEVTTRFVEWGTMNSLLEHGQFEGYVNAWREGTQLDLETMWHTPEKGVPNYNFGRYSNRRVDALIEKLRTTTDTAHQKPLADEIQQLIRNDLPYTFLYEGDRLVGLNRRVRNAVINDATPYFNLEDWYVVGPSQ